VLNLPDEEAIRQGSKATGLERSSAWQAAASDPRRGHRQRFPRWEGLVGKKLPALTRILDVTGERNDEMQAIPSPAPPNQLGSGTLTAMAVPCARV